MNKEEFAAELVTLFPDKATALSEHCRDYGELLGHVFFADEINTPLIELLRKDQDPGTIKTYCAFIEKMWSDGTFDVQNIVDVTILEQLSDEEEVWFRFGDHISNRFKQYINDNVMIENVMMWGVPKLICYY